MNEIKQGASTGVEGYSEAILDAFDRFGAVLEHPEGEAVSRRVEHANTALVGREVQEYLHSERAALQGTLAGASEGSAFGRGILKTLNAIPDRLGSTLEVATGVMNMARQFHRDREAGDTSYSGTMKAMAQSVAQISAGQAVGWMVGSAVATVTTVSLTPIIVGGAAALGAQYVIGKALGDRG
jgi:hypothetical protein